MFQFTLGVIVGIYFATYYDCKPMIEKIADIIGEPPKKM
uniref:Uncharacterized protein n=1 Tax=viral metagenome TaxID=1070528 RepID=A0A6C0F9U9_9ZZZZ|tara:strand:+ start:375 stop:491 length:117 start_codon:yes stop_codon:yes gene_type:complete